MSVRESNNSVSASQMYLRLVPDAKLTVGTVDKGCYQSTTPVVKGVRVRVRLGLCVDTTPVLIEM